MVRTGVPQYRVVAHLTVPRQQRFWFWQRALPHIVALWREGVTVEITTTEHPHE